MELLAVFWERLTTTTLDVEGHKQQPLEEPVEKPPQPPPAHRYVHSPICSWRHSNLVSNSGQGLSEILEFRKDLFAYLRVGDITFSLPTLFEAQTLSSPKEYKSMYHVLAGAFLPGDKTDSISISHVVPWCGPGWNDIVVQTSFRQTWLERLEVSSSTTRRPLKL